jgi:hypothetical protein
MANGFHGPREEWDRMAQPLLRLDSILEDFGRRHGLTLEGDSRWPNRSFRWGAPVSRLIQIFVDDESGPTYKVWIAASEDRASGRYWRQETPMAGAKIEDILARLPEILDEAFARVSSWNSSDLELARRRTSR